MKATLIFALSLFLGVESYACNLSGLRQSQLMIQAALSDFSSTLGRHPKTRIRQIHVEKGDIVEIHSVGPKKNRTVTVYHIDVNPDCSTNVVNLD